MKLGLETEALHLLFQQRGMDIFGFIDRTVQLGLEGVQINVIPDFGLHPVWGTLEGDEPGYLHRVRAAIDERGLFCEIDARGTTAEELLPVLRVANHLGSRTVRTYVRYPRNRYSRDFFFAQIAEVQALLPELRRRSLRLAIENHEYETSAELVEFVEAVGDTDVVGLHCDVGNSMMVWESPLQAIHTMAPYTFSVHFKDHVIVREPESPDGPARMVVCGVPLGQGSIDLVEAYRILAERSRADNINIETCFPYCADFKREPGVGGSSAFEGVFTVCEPPFPVDVIRPMQYYYPHAVSEAACARLIEAQTAGVRTSAGVLRRLRDDHDIAVGARHAGTA